MKYNYSYKFRLKPTKAQQEIFAKQFGGCRYVWNYFLNKRINLYKEVGKSMSYHDCAKELVELKKVESWISETNAQSLQASLEALDVAYSNFFKYKLGFPKFKSRKNNTQSYKVKQGVDIRENKIKIPKVGLVDFDNHRPVEGRLISATISKKPSGQYYIAICVEKDKELPEKEVIVKDSEIVGIDLGIKSLAILSNSQVIPNPKLSKSYTRALKIKQRKVAKKAKVSNRRELAKKRLAKLYQHIANKRNDYIQKATTKIVNENQIIILEDLAVKNMVKNHKLASAISDCAWSEFVRQLEYKARWQGKATYKIDRFYPSSKMCSNCGFINQKLTLKDRLFVCSRCNHTQDRDEQASQNIKTFGLQDILNQTRDGKFRCEDRGGYQLWQNNNGVNYLLSCETVARETINN